MAGHSTSQILFPPLHANIITAGPLLCTWVIYFLAMTFCWHGEILISEVYLQGLCTPDLNEVWSAPSFGLIGGDKPSM